MATTKKTTQSKNERQANLVAQPVEPVEEVVLDGNLEVVTDEKAKVQFLENEIALLKKQLEETKTQVKKATLPKVRKPSASELKAQHEAERAAMTAHLSDEELAAIAKSDFSNAYAGLAIVAQTPSMRRRAKKTARIASDEDIVTKAGVVMKPHKDWKPAVHFSAQDALEVVELHNQGVSKAEIARRKGCHSAYIAAIVSGRQWSKVTGIEKK